MLAATSVLALANMPEGPRDYSTYTYTDYVAEFGKAERNMEREELFTTQLKNIQTHNEEFAAGLHTWWLAVNDFTDWSSEEFKQILGRRPHNLPGTMTTMEMQTEDALPAAVDWREHSPSVVTPVKNQGGCGSCWAFASTEVVESAYAIASGKLLDLAPQTFVSCMKNPNGCGGTGGCGGAIAELAFNYTKDYGMALSKDFPYTASDSACLQYTPAVKVGGYVRLPSNNALALQNAIATVGPVAVSVSASWGGYGGGIFAGCTGDQDIDHAVVAVGYSSDYWLIRNSWGQWWGEGGYIRLTRATDNTMYTDSSPADGYACRPYPEKLTVAGQCGVLSDSAYPTGVYAPQASLVV